MKNGILSCLFSIAIPQLISSLHTRVAQLHENGHMAPVLVVVVVGEAQFFRHTLSLVIVIVIPI